MPMEVTVANKHVLNLLDQDIQAMARDLASTRRLRKPFEKMRDEVMIPSIRQNFEAGGRPKKWEPLSPITTGLGKAEFIASAATGEIGGRKPLNKTGQLKTAATAKARFHIRENQMVFGEFPARRWFGLVHDRAEIAARAEVPHRPFVLIQHPEDSNHMAEILMEWVEDTVNDNIKLRYR